MTNLPGDLRQIDDENERDVIDDDAHADPDQPDIGTFDPDADPDGDGIPDDAEEEDDELPVLDDEEDEPILDDGEDA